MKFRLFLFFALIFALPKDGYVSLVIPNDTTLGDFIASSTLIVVATPIGNNEEDRKVSGQHWLRGTFQIQKILLNKTKNAELKKGSSIKVYDANEQMQTSIGEEIKKYGYSNPKHPIPSPIINRYATSMTEAETTSDQPRILFLSQRSEKSDDFRYTIDSAFESTTKEKSVLDEIKKNSVR